METTEGAASGLDTDQTSTAQTDQATTTADRGRSTIVFPYFGLKDGVEIATIAHTRYGGRCGLDQLAATLNQKTSSGAFRLKVGAAKIFGLVTGSQTISVTDLGSRTADDRTAAEAITTAFLTVPLYSALYERFRNRTLPNDQGLEAAIQDLGVTPKQVTSARQVFQRSAEFAGFFAHGRDRLIMPPVGKLGKNDRENAGNNGDGLDTDEDQDQYSVMTDPLIVGLLERLPDPSQGDFPEDERGLWLATLEMNLAYIYSKPSRWKFKRPDPEAAARIKREESESANGQAQPDIR